MSSTDIRPPQVLPPGRPSGGKGKAAAVLLSSVLALPFALQGCATYGGWQPTVDPYGDRNAAAIGQDAEQCKSLSRDAGGLGAETFKGAGMGALLGAAGGAALGAVIGNPATGAAIGAAAGGIGGGAYGGLDADAQFRRAYVNCMRGRGHNVIN